MEYLSSLKQLRKKYLNEATGYQIKPREENSIVPRRQQEVLEPEGPPNILETSAQWLSQIRKAAEEAKDAVPEVPDATPYHRARSRARKSGDAELASKRPKPRPDGLLPLERRGPVARPDTRDDVITFPEQANRINAGYGDLTQGDIEDIIREEAKLRGISPKTAIEIARSEGIGSYQSRVERKGNGSYNGYEASWGPYQLFTGGGLGNEYEKATGRDLKTDNNRDGVTNQVRFALDKAVEKGWSPWYGRLVAGIEPWEGLENARVVGNWK